MTSVLNGVISALPTPFDSEQNVDVDSLRRLVRFNIEQNMHGLYVGGSTGEAFLQNAKEREAVFEVVAEEAKGKLALIAHVGGISSRESQELAKAAKKYGFDAVSAVTPFYYPFSFQEICEHYKSIINAADGLPMVVYNIPVLSGVRLSLEQMNMLIELPGVCALKQTSGDLFQMEQIRRAHPSLTLYNGFDEIFASGIIAGANGGIGSTYNIMGWRYKKIYSLLMSGDVLGAQKIQTDCNRVIDTLIKTGVLSGIKVLLKYMGVINSPVCRSPFSPVDEKYLPELNILARKLLEEKNSY